MDVKMAQRTTHILNGGGFRIVLKVVGGGVKFYRGRTTKGFGEMEYLPRERLNLILYYNAEHIEKDLTVVFIPPPPSHGVRVYPNAISFNLFKEVHSLFYLKKTIESYRTRLWSLLTYLADPSNVANF